MSRVLLPYLRKLHNSVYLRTLLARTTTKKPCCRMSTTLPVITVNKEESEVSIKLPGYSYDDLDRYGNVGIHKVSKMGEATRMFLYAPQFSGTPAARDPGYRMTIGRLYKDRLIFAISCRYDISPAFYGKSHLFNPVNSTDRLVNIGKSSYQHLNRMTSYTTGELLHKSTFQVVLVDKETRRPVPLPEYFTDQFKKLDVQVPFERVEKLEKPHITHKTQYTARWSDTDYYLHFNQSYYVRMCIDAMVEVSIGGSFNTLKGDICQYWVKNYTCFYHNESKPGDVLDVYVWEDEANGMMLHAIAEVNEKPVFQTSIEFANPSS